MVYGANEPITPANGGAIANVAIIDTREGAVVVDAGPSHRYGVELAALVETLTGKPAARVYITHIHSDHLFGASAFDMSVLRVGAGLPEDLKRRGDDIAAGMYRLVGDWMRGTVVPAPYLVAADGVEEVGGRRFRRLALSGHTALDLCLYEETSGLLFAGDLVFLDRAATTPDADLPRWRLSLDTLEDVPHRLLIPGHGPVEPGARGFEQTRRWLDLVETTVADRFDEGLDVLEMIETPLPDWTRPIAVARYEFQRSVMHLLPGVEESRLPLLA